MSCNHVWRDTPLPTAKQSKTELLSSIIDSGNSGWWLHVGEEAFAEELLGEGLIRFCPDCGATGNAAFAVAKKE
jgi:hypothetical protein